MPSASCPTRFFFSDLTFFSFRLGGWCCFQVGFSSVLSSGAKRSLEQALKEVGSGDFAEAEKKLDKV